MKVWKIKDLDKDIAQGWVDDEVYRYHVMCAIKGDVVVWLATKNRKPQ